MIKRERTGEKSRRKRRIRTAVLLVLLALSLLSLLPWVKRQRDFYLAQKRTDQLWSMAGQMPATQVDFQEEAENQSAGQAEETPTKEEEKVTEPASEDEAESLFYVDFSALTAINPDIAGWLLAPGAGISEPVVRAKDQETYLNHDASGQTTLTGAVFLDSAQTSDFEGDQTIFYGHHLKNGMRFGNLEAYLSEECVRENPFLAIVTPEKVIYAKVLLCKKGPADGEIRRFSFETREEKDAFWEKYLPEISAEEREGRLYTLITCDPDDREDRIFLFARSCGAQEEAEARKVLRAVSVP